MKYKESLVTYILICINILIFIITAFLSKSIYNIDLYTLIALGAKVNGLINNGQPWRLITCAFLHGGLAHIAFNMYALKIDYRLEPPMFKVSDTHYAATWLLHEKAPKIDMPEELKLKIDRMLKEADMYGREEAFAKG